MEIIELLRTEQQDLVDRLNEIDKMLRQYEELNRIAQALLTPSDSSTRVIDSSIPKVSTEAPNVSPSFTLPGVMPHTMPGLVRRKKTPTNEFERVVIDVLREANAPLDRAELYEALTKRGVVIGDGDRDKELNALSARVYRMAQAGHLESKRGQGYQLKKAENVDESNATAPEGDETFSNREFDDLLR